MTEAFGIHMNRRKSFRFLFVAGFFVLCFSGSVVGKKHSVLVVMTHGDDFVSIAPLLAKYSAEGHAVYYAMFTGLQDASGEENSKGREDLNCGAKALGVKHTFVMRGPAGESMQTLKAVGDRLIEIIDATKPDVIITWGPDGLTGHPRHVIVGNIVTRVFQQRANTKHRPRKLYYVAYPESIFPDKRRPVGVVADVDGPFGTVDDAFITTKVDGSRYLNETRASIACFTLTQEDNKKWQQKWTERLTSTLGGQVYLRLVMPSTTRRESSLFSGL